MSISIRLLQEGELPTAEHIFRIAFGTFAGFADPSQFAADCNYMNRWYTDPTAAFAAEDDGRLIGTNIAINWGSFGLFGPLTVHPDYWNQGVGQKLIEPAIEHFQQWQMTQTGFFTFSNSPKHLVLYQRFGFQPRFLTALLSRPIQPNSTVGTYYSSLTQSQQTEARHACFELTDSLYQGLDLSREIKAVAERSLGDTVLLWDEDRLSGFAVCHCGIGTEAGKETCYIKFGAVRTGATAAVNLAKLLQACETLAAQQGLSQLVCGVSTERTDAYQTLLALGFRLDRLGVTMHKPNRSGFCRSDVFVLDDWR
jgi:GNAT superfamily N-acetyltransferase